MLKDMRLSIKQNSLYIALLFISLIYSGELISHRLDLSIPDLYSVMFQGLLFIIIVIPIFLLFLSTILPPSFDSLRVTRYRSREKLTIRMMMTIFLAVCIYLSIYMLAGVLYGYYISGTFENRWITESGFPNLFFDGEINLALFQTNQIILKYVLTETLAFMIIGLLTACIFILTGRFIVTFFLIEGFLLFEYFLHNFLNVSLFIGRAQIYLDAWVEMSLGSVALYFIGIIIVLTVVLYIIIDKKDFIERSEDPHGVH